MDLQTPTGREGGPRAEVCHAIVERSGFRTNRVEHVRAHRVHAIERWQHRLRVEVGGWKPDGAAALIAAYHPTGEFVQAPEQLAGVQHIARAQRLANGSRRHALAVEHHGWLDQHIEAALARQAVQEVDVAGAPGAEAKIRAY